MKDVGKVIILIGIVILCFILQIYVFNKYTLFGVRGNIILTLVVVLAIWFKQSLSIPFSFVIGILSDLIFTYSIGKYVLTYVVLSLIIIAASTFYNKQNKGATILIVFIATIFAEYLFGIYNAIKFEVLQNVFSVTFVGLKGAAINIVLGVILTKILKGMSQSET